jgi:hypothetical protein
LINVGESRTGVGVRCLGSVVIGGPVNRTHLDDRRGVVAAGYAREGQRFW